MVQVLVLRHLSRVDGAEISHFFKQNFEYSVDRRVPGLDFRSSAHDSDFLSF